MEERMFGLANWRLSILLWMEDDIPKGDWDAAKPTEMVVLPASFYR
jgi:hypothetical protein